MFERRRGRSVRRRLAASIIALVTGCVTLGLIAAYLGAVVSHRENLDHDIRERAGDLVELRETEGDVALVERLAQPENRLWLYALWSFKSQTVRAGTVTPPTEALETGEEPASYWIKDRRVRGLVMEVDGGEALFVVRDITRQFFFERRLLVACLLAGAIVVALAVAMGLWTSRRLVGRVEAMNRTVVSILHGRRLERVPAHAQRDEFDDLAVHFNQVLDENERLITRVREATNDIAHDLRTPLAHIRSYLEAALARPRDGAQDETTLQDALSETNGLLATFQSLLSIARIEGGVVRDEMAVVDLVEVADRAVELYGPIAEDAKLRLDLRVASKVSVRGNSQLISQALMNLIDNAIKFSTAGSSIEVEVRETSAGAELRVADHGPGIHVGEREHVLKRFARLDASREKPGTGLGLSLVAAVVELHGARLELSDNGPGLVATIRFPNRAVE